MTSCSLTYEQEGVWPEISSEYLVDSSPFAKYKEKINSHRPDVTILFCLFHFHDYKPGGHVSPKEIALLTTGNVSGRYVYYLFHCYDQTSNRNTLWDEGFLLVHSSAAIPHCGGEGKIDDWSSSVCNGRSLQWQITSP